MICSNPECKKEYIPKRSDSKSCSIYCAKRNKFLKRADYYKAYLKEYRKAYYPKNKDKILARNKNLYYTNREKRLIQCKEYRLNNLEKDKLVKKLYKQNNRWKTNFDNARRRSAKTNATPKWVDLNKIKEVYKNCPKGYEVDHIIPLRSKIVCGLHVHWNLQYLTPSANLAKSNKIII